MKISRPASHIVATFLFCVMALAFGLYVRSELSKSTASAIRQAIFVIPYLVAVIALLRPPAQCAYYLCSALLFAFPVFIIPEPRRIGKEWVRTCRYRWSSYH